VDLRPDFYYCQTMAGLLMWGALSDERICSLQLLLVLASAVILGYKSIKTCEHILQSLIRDITFFITSYDSQGYGGGDFRLESSLMLRPTVSRPVYYMGIKHPSRAYGHIFITTRQLRVCRCGALSLTRGRVCRL
jgi:hypothetical protein